MQQATPSVPIMLAAAVGGLGATIGAALDEKQRVRGALLGGAVGLLSGAVVGYLISTGALWTFGRKRVSILEITRDSEGRIISMIEREIYE